MRIIKFRGKRLVSNDWEYGNLIQRPDGGNFIETGDLRICPLQDDTICQFTGWYDKDGKEMYEGDILDLYIPKNNIGKPEHRKRKIIFDQDKGGFSIVNKHNSCICDAVTTSIELIYTVIGNVYDTPELLEA